MLLAYVREAKTHGLLPTLGGFEQWVGAAENPRIKFCSVYVMQYLLGLKLFREGVRTGNPTSLHAGWAALSPSFFILRMPFYQELYFRYRSMLVEAPEEVRMMLLENVAFSENGQACKQQGEKGILLKLILDCNR